MMMMTKSIIALGLLSVVAHAIPGYDDFYSCEDLPAYWVNLADEYDVDPCLIGFNITEEQWYIDDEAACVSWGEYDGPCDTDYFCSGFNAATYGYGFQQMATLSGMVHGEFQSQHSLCPVCPPAMGPGFIDICHDGILYSFPVHEMLPSDFGSPGSMAEGGRGTWLTCDCSEVHIGHNLPAGTYWYNLAESYGLNADLVTHYNDVWYYNGQYSRVAKGKNGNSCDNTVYHCAGTTGDHFGYGGQQMAALKSASHLQTGAHADCPLR